MMLIMVRIAVCIRATEGMRVCNYKSRATNSSGRRSRKIATVVKAMLMLVLAGADAVVGHRDGSRRRSYRYGGYVPGLRGGAAVKYAMPIYEGQLESNIGLQLNTTLHLK